VTYPIWQETQSEGLVFGSLVTPGDVRAAAQQTLSTWFPTYVAAYNRAVGSQVLKVPADYRLKPQFRTLSQREDWAAILVDSPGTVGKAIRHGDGSYFVVYSILVDSFVYGSQSWEDTEDLAYKYAGVVQQILVQQGSLGGVADNTIWTGTTAFDPNQAPTATRTTAIMRSTFEVAVSNVLSDYGGPTDPSPAPPPEPNFASTATVTLPEPLT
jgi:hypothetical protein